MLKSVTKRKRYKSRPTDPRHPSIKIQESSHFDLFSCKAMVNDNGITPEVINNNERREKKKIILLQKKKKKERKKKPV